MTSTSKHISDHPPKGTVTQPTDKNVKERDIQRKMKFISVIDAMRQGKMPTNKQIDENMQYVLGHSPIDTTQLSREGQELVNDVQSLIETARQIVMTKNADEVFQSFMWAARDTDNAKINPANQVSGEVSKDQAKAEGNESVQHLKTLGKLLLSNGEFRKVAKDLGLIARDVAADGAQKAADKSRPNEEQRQQVDEPAGSHEWVSYEEGMAPINKTRDAAKNVQQTAQNKKEEARAEGQATREDPERQNRIRQGIGQLGAEVRDPNNQDALRDPEVRGNLQQDAKERAKERIPEEQQDKIRERKEKTKEYAKEKFSEERRDRFIYRLKKIIIECQEQPDYQEAIEFFLNTAENYKVRADRQHSQVAGHAKDNVMGDPAFSSAFNNFRTLLERFANGQSMQPIFDATDDIYTDANNDPELKSWFTTFGKYIRRVLQEPGFVMTDECDEQGRVLRQNGKGFFSERYRPHREAWTNAVENWFKAYADDPLNVQFGEDVKRITKQLALDSDGKLTYKPNLWQDVRSVILPGLLDQIGYVPIPRIDYSDKQVDLVIENLTLESKNMLPNILELEATNHFKLSQHKEISNNNRHNVVINFSQIQCDLKDVAFYYKKKTGFPKMSDSGLLDVLIGGEGLSGQIHLASSAAKHRIFDIKDVTVKMHQSKITIHDASKHGVLYSVFGPLANSVIKAAVPKAIQQAIRNALEELDRQLVDINEHLEEADRSEDQSKADVLKDLFKRKKDTGEAKGQDAKQTAEKRNSQFKVVLREEDRILDWESKQSMVRRQGVAEKEIKDQSDQWRSPIFDATTRPVRPAS